MEGIAVTPDNFETEVLKSDKPVLVILLPINYGDESDPNDDSIRFFDISLAEFKSKVQEAATDKYKIALIDQRYVGDLNLSVPIPPIYPPPLAFLVFQGGEGGKSGALIAFSKDAIFESLKAQLSN